MLTPAQREQRRTAGRASGASRSGKVRQESQPGGDPDAPMPSSGDADVDAQMASYIALAGKPRYWPDVKACEQVRAEIYRTRAAARADQIERGKLMTVEQVEASDERMDAIFMHHLNRVVEFAGTLVPPEKKTEARAKAEAWVNDTKSQIADELRQP